MFSVVGMASGGDQQSSGLRPEGGPPPPTGRRPLFTDIRGAEEVVAQLMATFQAYRSNVAKDFQSLYEMIVDVSNRMEASLNELNKDTVVMYRDITLLRQQAGLTSAHYSAPEELYPQPSPMLPSEVRPLFSLPPLAGRPMTVSSGSSAVSCPTVASISLPRVTPFLAPSAAKQGGRAERCESAAPEGPRPKEVRPGPAKSNLLSARSSEVPLKGAPPAQPTGQKTGPGPMGGNLNTILRRERRKRQMVRQAREQTIRAPIRLNRDARPEVELSASPLGLSSGPSDTESPVRPCTMEVEGQAVVRRVRSTPSPTPSSTQNQNVPSTGATIGQATTGQSAAPNTQQSKKEEPPNVWFGARDVRLKQGNKGAVEDAKE